MDIVTALSYLDKMKSEGKNAFYMREFAALSKGESIYSVGMSLTRLRQKGIIDRCENVWFIRSDPSTIFEVARLVEPISYLSLESALFERNILSQASKTLTMVTTGRPGEVKTSLGNIIFHHIKVGIFFGFDPDAIAYPEKALLDLIYLKRKKGIPLPWDSLYTNTLDHERLKEYSKCFPDWVYRYLIENLS